jgi:hypothetical protein
MHGARTERPKLDVAPFAGIGLFEVPEKAPEPVPAPPAQAPARAPARRTIALVAGAVMAVAVASAIAIFKMRGAADARVPPLAELHAVTVLPSPPPEPPRIEAPTATEAKPVETAAKPPPGPPRDLSRRGIKPLGSAGIKPDSPKPTPACDLMCQMKKAVGGPH